MVRLNMRISDVLFEMGFRLAAERWQLGQKALYLGLAIDLCRGTQFIPKVAERTSLQKARNGLCREFTLKPFHSF